jgi:hypothetical protein
MITAYYQKQRISSVPKTPGKQTSETIGLIESIFHENRVPKPNVFGTRLTGKTLMRYFYSKSLNFWNESSSVCPNIL